MEKSQIAVLIPVYNELNTIKKIIKEINSIATPVVIDDGSTDGSNLVIRSIARHYLVNKINKGYEYSLNRGFKYIKKKFRYMITFDADGQHKISDLKKVIFYLNKNYDIVICQRKILQRFSEKIFSFFFNLLFKCRDPLCGLKGYNLIKFKKKNFSNSKTCGVEFLIYALNKNLKKKYLQIYTNKRKDSSRYGNFLKGNFLIIKSFFLIILKKY